MQEVTGLGDPVKNTGLDTSSVNNSSGVLIIIAVDGILECGY